MSESQQQLPAKNRLRWMCRRGMLELDVLLERFINQQYDQLNIDQQQVFVQIIEMEDPWLYAHIVKGNACDNAEWQKIIEKIRQGNT